MSRFITMKCPKCGGMYMRDGRCETCGQIIIESKSVENAASPSPIQEQEQKKEMVLESPQKPMPSSVEEKKPVRSQRGNFMVCPDCGRMISKDAFSCPQCGCPFPGNMMKMMPQKTETKKSGIGIFGIICGVVIGGLVFWYLSAPYSTPVWLQRIFGTIRCFFTGETSYQIFDPSKLGK